MVKAYGSVHSSIQKRQNAVRGYVGLLSIIGIAVSRESTLFTLCYTFASISASCFMSKLFSRMQHSH